MGWIVVRNYRARDFVGGLERGAGSDVWIFDFAAADRAEVCADDAAVLFECVVSGRVVVGLGILDRV